MAYAAYCLKGHLIGRVDRPVTPSKLRAWTVREVNGGVIFPPFCKFCGSKTLSHCQHCANRIAPDSKFCGGCSHPFPWTEDALTAAKEFADDLQDLSASEKTELKETFSDLTVDTPRTPLAMSRFEKYMKQVGPLTASTFKQILQAVVSETVKQGLGRWF
jgi:hypothetical protein